MFEQAKAKAQALAATALAHGVKNSLWSIEKDGGVFSRTSIAKSAVTYGASIVAVEALTGSLFFGLVTGVLADCGRVQVEGRLYAEQSAKNFAEEQDIRDALFEEDVHTFEDDYYPGLFTDPFETACEIPDSHTYRGE